MISAPPSVDSLWLDTLHRICGRAAHELKGVMNGVSVNLEVVRSRAGKADTPASAVATFATSAATQFDAVIDMTEALLGLTRPASGALDLGVTARRVAALLAPAARVDGREIQVDSSLETAGTTPAAASATRLAIGSALLSATESAAHVRCVAAGGALRIECGEGESIAAPNADVIAAAREAGIEIQAEPSAISINFPR